MEAATVPPGRARDAARPMVRAFWSYPETVHLLPRESARRHALPRFLVEDCVDAARFGTLVGVVAEGEVVGAAAWLPPHAYPVGWRRQLRQALRLVPSAPWSVGALREALRGRQVVRNAHPPEPHYFLRSIGVDPEHQRRRVGSALMAPMLERADGEGVGCYLTTALHDNLAWYQRFGFSVLSEFRPTPRWPTVWSLWRAPPEGGDRAQQSG